MTGTAALVVRYVLIIAAGWLAHAGIGVFDADTATFTISIDNLASIIGGGVSLVAAVFWRKWAVWRGGKT